MKKLLLLLILCASSASAAVTHVQNCTTIYTSVGAGGTITCTFGSNVSSGDLLVASSQGNVSLTVLAISSSPSLTWTLTASENNTTTGNVYQWWAVATSTASTTLTISTSLAALIGVVSDEYTGLPNWKMDQVNVANQTTGSSPVTTPSVTTTQANEVVVVVTRFASGYTSNSGPFTVRGNISFGGINYVPVADLLPTSIGTYSNVYVTPGVPATSVIASFGAITRVAHHARIY